MVTRAQVEELRAQGLGYDAIGSRLGVRPGLAYLVGTGLPADRSDAPAGSRPGQLPSSQHLATPAPVENPTRPSTVPQWVAQRARSEAQMQQAALQAAAKGDD